MFSTSTLLSLVSLSLLSASVSASPIQSSQITSRDTPPCSTTEAGPGGLCKLNGQDFNIDTTLTNTFSFDAEGKTGLSNAIDYFSLDFQPVDSNSGDEYLGLREFHPVVYNIEDNVSTAARDFHYDNVQIPCGLAGKSYLNLVQHTSAGVNHTTSVGIQRFGPFNVNSDAC